MPGYTGPNGGTCTSCGAGKYKSLQGNSACVNCPSYSTSVVASTDVSQCLCAAGYTLNASMCNACPANTFKNSVGASPCTPCTSTQRSAVGSSSCVEVATNTQCPNLCRAPAGYAVTASGMNVQTCPANHYNSGSAKACTTCPWPQTFTAGTGLTSVAQCACRPGYERVGGVGGVCTACALGSFKNTTGDAACASCAAVLGPHSTTLQSASANASACVCKPGYAVVGGACQLTACPAGSVVVLTQSAASCQCAPGFAFGGLLQNGSVVCAACGDGLFKDFIGNAACTSCGANTVSLAPRANRTACACAPDTLADISTGDATATSPRARPPAAPAVTARRAALAPPPAAGANA